MMVSQVLLHLNISVEVCSWPKAAALDPNQAAAE
jgi:hypothetical protein